MAQGSGGGFEVSQRMTALLGWGGTTKFAEAGWVGETWGLAKNRLAYGRYEVVLVISLDGSTGIGGNSGIFC